MWAQAPTVKSTPALSESQQRDIERFNLQARIVALEKEIMQLKIHLGKALEAASSVLVGDADRAVQREIARIKEDIEASNPGYIWDPASGTFAPKPPSP